MKRSVFPVGLSKWAFMAALAGSCGGSGAPVDPVTQCESCRTRGHDCSWTPDCPTNDCHDAISVECVDTCSREGSNCREGYPCLRKQNGHLECSSRCVNASCTKSGQECVAGDCQSVVCGESVVCADVGMFCFHYDCFPTNGDCSSRPVCPNYPRGMAARCIDGYCRTQAPAADTVYVFPDVEPLDVSSPSRGDVFPDGVEPTFSWNPVPNGLIALVLTKTVTSQAGLLDAAIWGKTVTAGSAVTIGWQEGQSIVNGVWTAATPGPPPSGVPLYFYLQEVARGELIAHSNLIPFAYGMVPWAVPGASCDPTVSNSCFNPAKVLTCLQDGTCAAVCASHLDCQEDGLSCGAVDPDDVRVCH